MQEQYREEMVTLRQMQISDTIIANGGCCSAVYRTISALQLGESEGSPLNRDAGRMQARGQAPALPRSLGQGDHQPRGV